MIRRLLLVEFFLFHTILFSLGQPMVKCLTMQNNSHVSRGFGWNGKSAGISDNGYLWDNGRTIYIKFMNGTGALKTKTQKIIKELEQFANLKFEFVQGESHIRIDFNNQQIIASALGNMSNMLPQEESTLTIDTTYFHNKSFFRSIVLHTINHAIGIQDEIIDQSTILDDNGINHFFNSSKANWPFCINKDGYFRKYSFNFSNTLKHDPNSIMNIPLSKNLLNKEILIKWNKKFSQKDKSVLASLYPKSEKIYTDSTKPVIKFQDLVTKKSLMKNGFSFYPQFDFLVSNKSYSYEFLLFVCNEKGQYIQQFDDTYNLENQLGDVFVLPRFTAKNQKVNQPKLDGIEFFIPNQYFKSDRSTKNFSVVFKIYYNDYNYETQLLYESKPYKLQLP